MGISNLSLAFCLRLVWDDHLFFAACQVVWEGETGVVTPPNWTPVPSKRCRLSILASRGKACSGKIADVSKFDAVAIYYQTPFWHHLKDSAISKSVDAFLAIR